MLKSSQFARSAAIAATMISVAAGPAAARQADMPAGARHAVAAHASTADHWTQPRVDSTGVRPVDSPAVTSSAPAEPVTRPTDGSGALQWLLIPLAGLMLACTLIIVVSRAGRHAAHSFRARHV